MMSSVIATLFMGIFIGSGYAAHYNEGLMERVAHNRGMAQSACMISYTEADEVGEWLIVQRGNKRMHCQIVDVPQPYDRPMLKKRHIIVELNFSAAQYLCGIKYVGQEPPRACPVNVYRYGKFMELNRPCKYGSNIHKKAACNLPQM